VFDLGSIWRIKYPGGYGSDERLHYAKETTEATGYLDYEA
jgi:hypothetical protein